MPKLEAVKTRSHLITFKESSANVSDFGRFVGIRVPESNYLIAL
jgi:hypothetical protein